jgi:hypothetical protein
MQSSLACACATLAPQHFDFSLWRDFLKGLDANEAAMSLDPREFTAVCGTDLKWLFFECREMFAMFTQVERALNVSPRRFLSGDFPTPRLSRIDAELAVNSYFASNGVILRAFLSRSPSALLPLLQISKKSGNDARRNIVSQIAEETGCRIREVGRNVVILAKIFETGEACGWSCDIESLLVHEYCISDKFLRQDWLSFIIFARFRIVCGGASVSKRVSLLPLSCLLDCSDALLILFLPQNKNHCILSIDVNLVSSLKDVLRKLKTETLSEWVSFDVLKCFSESRFASLVKAVKEFHTAILSASSEGLRDFFGIAVRCVDSLTSTALLASTTDGRLPALTDVQLSNGFREITKFLVVGVTGGAPELYTRFVLFVEKVVLLVYSSSVTNARPLYL